MPAFTLYGFRGSVNVDRVRLMLAEGGFTDYELAPVDLRKGEHKTPEHLARNPWGKVPVVTFPDGFTVYESVAICKYLARKFAFPLLPPAADLEATARFDEAEAVEMSYFVPKAGAVVFETFAKSFLGLPPDQAVIADALWHLQRFSDVTDRLLRARDYMAGDRFTLVDIYYIPVIQWLVKAGHGDVVLGREAVRAWWDRCVQRPAIQKLLAEDAAAAAAAAAARN